MKNKIGILLWKSFNKVWGVPAVVLGLVLAFVFWQLTPDKTIGIGPFVLVLIFLTIAIITLINLNIELYSIARLNSLPSIKLTRKSMQQDGIKLILLLEPNEWFSYDSLVTIYKLDNEFEQIFGIGKVINVQQNGMIQIGLIQILDKTSDTFEKLSNNDKDIIERIIIKPTVPTTAYNSVQN